MSISLVFILLTYFNHIFYFSGLTPDADRPIPEPLSAFLIESFQSPEKFKEKFKAAALSVFGSGYAWLTIEPTGRLCIFVTKNQDTPLPAGLFPLLNIDVWEHAYYLKHYNERAAYIDDWFHIADFARANEHLLSFLHA